MNVKWVTLWDNDLMEIDVPINSSSYSIQKKFHGLFCISLFRPVSLVPHSYLNTKHILGCLVCPPACAALGLTDGMELIQVILGCDMALLSFFLPNMAGTPYVIRKCKKLAVQV